MSNDGQSAVTIIGFVGSVFSPYYAWARRRGPADPENHVAINVAVYGKGGGWAMTERGRRWLDRGPSHFRVGPSGFRVEDGRLVIDFSETRAPLPRRLKGRVTVDLPDLLAAEYPLDLFGSHVWRPIAPTARMTVEMEEPGRSWQGDAYVDHNHGSEPLEIAFRSWTWSRVTHAGGTSIFYALEPRHSVARAFRLDIGLDGSKAFGAAPPEVTRARTGWGLSRSLRSEPGGPARVLRTLEDTPFYARSLVELQADGRAAKGVHESLSLDRFRTPIVQLMLPFRMPRRS